MWRVLKTFPAIPQFPEFQIRRAKESQIKKILFFMRVLSSTTVLAERAPSPVLYLMRFRRHVLDGDRFLMVTLLR